jgi:phenylacetic acid degradation operon negative regulatory protein
VEPSPRSLILDLLSTVGRAAAPVRALVEAAGLFQISAGSLRVALARLLADGLVERDARGLYRLGARARGLAAEVSAWREVERRVVAWRGGWIGAHTAAPAGSARARDPRARALRLLGFRPVFPGLALRPDNLAGGVDGVRRRLAALGAGAVPVFTVSDLDAEAERAARAGWDAEELTAGYKSTRAALLASAARLAELPVAAARAESFQLGGAAIRQIVLDPLLPEPIVAAKHRAALLEAMLRYDRIGRRMWAGWLGGDEGQPAVLPAGVGAPAELARSAT